MRAFGPAGEESFKLQGPEKFRKVEIGLGGDHFGPSQPMGMGIGFRAFVEIRPPAGAFTRGFRIEILVEDGDWEAVFERPGDGVLDFLSGVDRE